MTPDTEDFYSGFRKRFPIFREKIYLNSCSQGALSDDVESALNEFTRSWHQQGSPWDHWIEVQEDLRREFASMIGAAPDEVAITFAASTAISSVASALDFGRRPNVLLGELEFPTMSHIWLAQIPRGARITWVPSRDGTNKPEDYRARADSQTLIIPATHVCFRNGFRNDAAGIARAAHDAGAYFMLDDYQSCGTRPIDVRELQADFYVAGALKYLLGTAGVGFLFAKRELIETLHPTMTGWFAQSEPFAFDSMHHCPASNAARFQSGTPPVMAVYAALAGVRLLRNLGLAKVELRIAELTRRFITGAAARGWKLKTPPDSTGPLVVIESTDAARLVNELAKQGIIVSSRNNGLRVSFHAYNTPGDIDVIFEALGRLL
jgi:selenocysteine lyase/cysteine desulfurase